MLHSYRIFPLREFLDIVAETTSCKIEETQLRGFLQKVPIWEFDEIPKASYQDFSKEEKEQLY